MKKFLLPLPLLAAFVLTAGTATAQASTAMSDGGAMQGRGRLQGSPDEMAKRQTERLTQELGLTADQAPKVQQIMLARGQEMQAMRGQGDGNRDQMREQMQASRAKYDGQFKAVLTPDQYTKYATIQAERMNRGGGRGMDGPGPDGANVDKMKAKTTDGEKIKVTNDKVKVK